MLGGWAEGAGTSERAWPAPCPQGPASACRGSCSPGPGRCSPDCPRHTSHSSSRLSVHARSSPSCRASLAPAPSHTRGTWRPGCPAPGSGPARPPCPPSPLSAQSQSWTPPRRFPRETCHSSWRDYTCSVQPEKLCMFPGTTIQFRVTSPLVSSELDTWLLLAGRRPLSSLTRHRSHQLHIRNANWLQWQWIFLTDFRRSIFQFLIDQHWCQVIKQVQIQARPKVLRPGQALLVWLRSRGSGGWWRV